MLAFYATTQTKPTPHYFSSKSKWWAHHNKSASSAVWWLHLYWPTCSPTQTTSLTPGLKERSYQDIVRETNGHQITISTKPGTRESRNPSEGFFVTTEALDRFLQRNLANSPIVDSAIYASIGWGEVHPSYFFSEARRRLPWNLIWLEEEHFPSKTSD